MAKQMYLVQANATTHSGNNDAKLNGVASGWQPCQLSETRGTTGTQEGAATTVVGPTNGIEAANAGTPIVWLSEPLSADFTIAGTITLNLWACESTMNDNVAINAVIEKVDGATGAITQITKTARVVECAIGGSGAEAVNNFTATPTSTAVKRGDRLRVRVFGDDVGTMAVGAFYFAYSASTAAAAGDSWLQFTENLTFEPAGDPGLIVDSGSVQMGQTNSFGNLATNVKIAQSFMAVDDTLHEVQLYLSKVGSPTDNLTITLQSGTTSAPSGTVVATIGTLAGTAITSSAAVYTFTSLGISGLTVGSTYWICVTRSGAVDAANYYQNPYASGQNTALLTSTYVWWNGSVWSAANPGWNMRFRTQGFQVSTYYLTDTTATGLANYIESGTVEDSVTAFGSNTTIQQAAQSFVAASTSVSEIRVRLKEIATMGDNVVVEIQSDSAGSPSGTVVGTVGTILGTALTPSTATYTLPCSISVTVGTTYWVVVRRSGAIDAVNYAQIGYMFVGWGTALYKTYNGSTWATQSSLALFMRITWGGANPADKQATTAVGTGVINSITTTVAGPTAPIQITDINGAGGVAIEWYTPPLIAFTLAGKAKFNMRAFESNASANASLKVEIAVVNGDGTGAVVWGAACLDATITFAELATTAAIAVAWPSGDDLAVTTGQRLRFRIYVDDYPYAMLVASYLVRVAYNGNASDVAAGSGDTYVILPTAVTEQILSTPKSGTDSNGATTESAAYGVTALGTDSNSGITETLGARTLGVSDGPVSVGATLHDGSAMPIGDTAQRTRLAQSFTPSVNMTIQDLQVFISRTGSPSDSVQFQICTDSSGSPGSILGEYYVYSPDIPAVGGTWFPISASGIINQNLLAGTTYWIVAQRTGSLDGSNYIWWTATNGTPVGVHKQFNGTIYSTVPGMNMSFKLTTPMTTEAIGDRKAVLTDANVVEFGAIAPLGGTYSIGQNSTAVRNAQQFQLGRDFKISDVQVYIRRNGSAADNINFAFQADVAGQPSGTNLYSANFPTNSIPTTAGWFSLYSTGGPPLTFLANTPYWLVASRDGGLDASNFILWTQCGNVYLDGIALNYDGGGFWTGASGDYAFRIFPVLESATVSQPVSKSSSDSNGGITESAAYSVSVTATDVGVGGGPGYSGAVVSSGPSLYLRLADPSGTTAVAQVGSNGTYNGSPALNQAGAISGDAAVLFDGVDDWIGFPTDTWSLPGMTSEITFECWYKGTDTDGWLFAGRDLGNGNPIISFNLGYNGVTNTGTGKPSIIVRDSGGSGLITLVAAAAVNDGNWHHLVATRTSPANQRLWQIYIDGVASGSSGADGMGACTGMGLQAIGSERNWVANAVSVGQMQYLSGTLDEPAIYTRALSPAEILAHYNARANPAGTEVATVLTPTPKSGTDSNSTITETGTAYQPQSKSGSDQRYAASYTMNGPDDPSNGSPVGIGAIAANTKVAQSFVWPNLIQQITACFFWMQRYGTPADTLTLEIQTDLAGSPSGTVIASTSMATSGVTSGSQNWQDWATGGIVNANIVFGQTYWFVFSRSGALDPVNRVDVWTTTTPYADGVTKQWDGAAWQPAANDISFKMETRKEVAFLNTKTVFPTDVNGSTTESGSVVATTAVSGTDANTPSSLGGTEYQFVLYPLITSADVDGANPEVSALVAAIPATDVDGANPEAQAVTAAISAADASGITTESTSIVQINAVTGTDTNGATIETPTPKATPTVTDANGVVTETPTLTSAIPVTDANGATTEAGTATPQIVPVSGTDANSLTTESIAQVASSTTIDVNATTTESATLAQVNSVSSSDTNGTTTESVGKVSVATDVNGTTTEAISTFTKVAADINGATTESGSLTSAIPNSDANGATTEAFVIVASATTADVNAGIAEAVSRSLQAADTNGTTSESGSLTSITQISGTDTNGAVTEAISQVASVTTTDVNAATTESAGIALVSVDNSGPTTESVFVLTKTTTDANGATTEAFVQVASATTADAGGATAENTGITSVAQFSSADSGSGSDVGIVSRSPLPISGLALWLDASQLGLADGAAVSPWPNLANSTLPGSIVGTPAPKVRANAQNGLSVARFNLNEGGVRISGTGVNADFTLVYVGRAIDSTPGRVISGIYPPNNILIGYWNGFMDVGYDAAFMSPNTQVAQTNDWKMYSGDGLTGVRTRLFSNGVLLGTQTLAPLGWGGSFAINGYDPSAATETTNCEVAEVLFYNRALSATERQQVEAYLRDKWFQTPVPAADSNGGTTENTNVVTTTATPDSNSVLTEAVALLAQSSIADTNGVLSEAAAVNNAVLAATDQGVAAEAITLTVPTSSADVNGATTEVVSAAAKVTADAGVIAETIGNRTATLTDVNASTTEAAVGGTSTPVFGTDSMVATEAPAVIKAVASTADTATLTDVALLVYLPIVTDAGIGTEAAPTLKVVLPVSDAGAGADIASLLARPSVTDAGTATEVGFFLYLPISVDAASGADIAAVLVAPITTPDSGTSTDTALLAAKYTVTDAGSATDTQSPLRVAPLGDFGTATEIASVRNPVTLTDTARGTDVEQLVARYIVSDFGSATFVVVRRAGTTIGHVPPGRVVNGRVGRAIHRGTGSNELAHKGTGEIAESSAGDTAKSTTGTASGTQVYSP